MPEPPDYLIGKVIAPAPDGLAAAMLSAYEDYRYEEPLFHIYDVVADGVTEFLIQLSSLEDPEEDTPYAVRAVPVGGEEPFLLFDPRRHPLSLYSMHAEYRDREPVFYPPHRCPKCRADRFSLAVRFEMDEEILEPNMCGVVHARR